MLTSLQLTAPAQKAPHSFGLLQRKDSNRRKSVQTLLQTHGEERERSSTEVNKAMMIYTPYKSGP